MGWPWAPCASLGGTEFSVLLQPPKWLGMLYPVVVTEYVTYNLYCYFLNFPMTPTPDWFTPVPSKTDGFKAFGCFRTIHPGLFTQPLWLHLRPLLSTSGLPLPGVLCTGCPFCWCGLLKWHIHTPSSTLSITISDFYRTFLEHSDWSGRPTGKPSLPHTAALSRSVPRAPLTF